jgi:hypothetical protein
MTGSGLQVLGDWRADVKTGLANALYVSVDICGRTGVEACKHALILMAESARARTKQAAEKRPIQRLDIWGAGGDRKKPITQEYIEVYNQASRVPTRLFKFHFDNPSKYNLRGTFDSARIIAHRGLAKRSWTWDLNRIGGTSEGRPIAGASRLYTLMTEKICGYVKENRLNYIQTIMPGGWEQAVQEAAGNKIMKQAQIKLQNEWASKLGSYGQLQKKTLSVRQLSDSFSRAG